MEIKQQLKTLGLHKTEIAVYLFLLKNGFSSPPIIARETKIARTNCYNILTELKNKRLIEEKIRAKRKVYQTNEPVALIKLLEDKVADAQKILPELQAIRAHKATGREVELYQGLEQIKELYEKGLSAKNMLSSRSRKQLKLLILKNQPLYDMLRVLFKIVWNNPEFHKKRLSGRNK